MMMMMAWAKGLILSLAVVSSFLYSCHAEVGYVITPPCNTSNMPVVSLDPEKVQGVWYLKMSTTMLPPFENLTAYEGNVLPLKNNDSTVGFKVDAKAEYSDTPGCIPMSWQCLFSEDGCKVTDIDLTYNFNFIDYDSMFATYSEMNVGGMGMVFPMFAIYVRDPATTLDLMPFKDDLTRFCGEAALNPQSGFYSKVLHYENSKCVQKEKSSE